MKHLIVLAGLILCSQVHADPSQATTHRKPVDYSRSHALSGAPSATGTTQSALDNLISSRGLGSADKGIERGTQSELMSDEVAAWLSMQNTAPQSVADRPASASSAAQTATARLADRFATLVVDAISHIGIPYKYGGNSVESGGFDCSGFVKAVYHEALGTILPRRSEEQAAATEKIERTQLQPGDLVFFKTTRRAFSHVGIYVGDDKFVHAPRTGARIRMENMTDTYWTQRFNGARRVQVADAAAVAQMGIKTSY